MKAGSISSVLVVASVPLALVAFHRWSRAIPDVVVNSPVVLALRVAQSPIPDDSLADAEDLTVTNDPFRLSNRAANTRYDPAADGGFPIAHGSASPSSPRPTLALKAIAGGPPWQALIDGLPGQPGGAVVLAGDKFDKLVIRTVTRDSVIIQAPDTTWVLDFRKHP
jgi:hypothetical protein